MILAPLTVDMRMASVRFLHFSAINLHKLNTLILPSPKGKRRPSRLELVEDEPRYSIGDDGEINLAKRRV